MSTVGIRELKARLSAFIRRVRTGDIVYVTDHGRIVAELRAPVGVGTSSSGMRRWEEAVAQGWIVPAARAGDRSWIDTPGPMLPAGTAAGLLDAERGE
jgi:antitoxin (DNA-binding transcriptional repressor) of toxin-antitoxin stability system